VRSIKSLNSFQRFKNELSGFVSMQIDIIILSETWTCDTERFNIHKLTNYQNFSCSRNNSNGGGVMVYVHNKHVAKIVKSESLDYMEYVSLMLMSKNMRFLIYAAYRPPNTCTYSFFQKFEEIIDNNEHLIIAGDLNINQLKLDQTSIQFLDIVNNFGATITNGAITRSVSGSIIDYFIVKNFPINVSTETLTSSPLLSSDHNLLLSLINVSIPTKEVKTVVSKKCNYTYLRDVFQCDKIKLSELSADECCNYLCTTIRDAMSASTSIKTIKLTCNDLTPPWADLRYHNLTKKASNLQMKINRLDKHKKPTSILKEKLNWIKGTINNHSNKISKKFYSQLIRTNGYNSWNVINTILGKKKSAPRISITINDKIIEDTKEIAEIFNKQFSVISNLSSLSSSSVNNFSYNGPTTKESMYFHDATYDEISDIISGLDPKKATGSDDIPCRIIKELKDSLIVPLTNLINKIIAEHHYPDSLKFATVKPLYKKGDKNIVSNYRPIALLPVINKIFERIISNRILSFLDSMEVNDKEQFGYKKHIGTNEAILKFSHDVSKYLDSGDYVIVVFMDLTAAFDTLNRDILLEKLSHLGIRGHVHHLLKSYFSNRSQAVKIENVISEKVIIDLGVAQGSILGPPLFNINQYDSPNITSSRIKFADDNTIYRNCSKENFEATLTEIMMDVKEMALHFESSGLKLNYSKTRFMVIGSNDKIEVPREVLITDDIKIERISCIKFLGISVDDKFNFKEHHSNLIGKLTQSCRALSIIKHHLPRELLIQFFHAHVMSHLHYCPFLFAKLTQEEILRLQRIQNCCIKQIFGLDKRHSTLDLFKTHLKNVLPVIGIIYASLITNIQKSLIFQKDEFLKFEITSTNRRSSGEIVSCRFRKRQHLGTDISYLGVILYNQLPTDLKQTKNFNKFKIGIKRYLSERIDLLLAPDQFKTRRIS